MVRNLGIMEIWMSIGQKACLLLEMSMLAVMTKYFSWYVIILVLYHIFRTSFALLSHDFCKRTIRILHHSIFYDL